MQELLKHRSLSRMHVLRLCLYSPSTCRTCCSCVARTRSLPAVLALIMGGATKHDTKAGGIGTPTLPPPAVGMFLGEGWLPHDSDPSGALIPRVLWSCSAFCRCATSLPYCEMRRRCKSHFLAMAFDAAKSRRTCCTSEAVKL